MRAFTGNFRWDLLLGAFAWTFRLDLSLGSFARIYGWDLSLGSFAVIFHRDPSLGIFRCGLSLKLVSSGYVAGLGELAGSASCYFS